MKKYFYTDGVSKIGPFSKEELLAQNISRHTKVWCFGMENWTELCKVSDLDDILSKIPPEIQWKNRKNEDNTNVSLSSNPIDIEPIKKNSNKNKKIKWAIGLGVLILFFMVIINLLSKESDRDKYKKIIENSYEGDEDFNVYVEKFYRDLDVFGIYPKRSKTTIIKFSNLDQLNDLTHINGLSLGINDDDRIEIYINPSSWRQFTKPKRYFLMYHELAHDVLNLKDLDVKPENKNKLMYPVLNINDKMNMDEFIEMYHSQFEEYVKDNK